MALTDSICSGCGNNTSIQFFTLTDRLSGNPFNYVQCTRCGTVYLTPQLTIVQLMDYYPAEYEPYRINAPQEARSSSTWQLSGQRIQLDFVERFTKRPGRLLDVGCATGDFLFVADGRGWIVTGIEIVEPIATYAREVQGFDVRQEEITNTSIPDSTFDVITLWDVLEHLPNPNQAIQRCYELLVPGGYLFFSIPNLDSIDRYLFGKTWIGWDPPRHLHLFTNNSLRSIVSQSGFEFVHSQCIIGGKGTFLLSLEIVLGKSKLGVVLKKLFPLISVLTFPYRRIAYLMNRGPVITYVFHKPLTEAM